MNPQKTKHSVSLLVFFSLFISTVSTSLAQDFDGAEFTAIHAKDNIYYLDTGRGRNVGDNGVLVVNDRFVPSGDNTNKWLLITYDEYC